MKLIIILILLILSKIMNGGEPTFDDCVLRSTITEGESKFSDRLDVAGQNSMTFCYQEEFERVQTCYYNGLLVYFITWKVTQRHAVGMEKQALTWVMIYHRITEEAVCLNFPQLNIKPSV